jgi:tRNA(fMet)-specific endonuclease VapC
MLRGKAILALTLDMSEAGISSIVEAELWVGAFKRSDSKKAQEEVRYFLEAIPVAHFDSVAALRYGELRVQLERQGQIIGANDLLIAAHALSLGSTLVTANIREFSRVKGLNVLPG